MNNTQVNAFRASIGLPAITPKKDSRIAQKRQRDNQMKRAAEDQKARDSRGRESK